MTTEDLETQVTAVWGASQFDWTVGRCPEGWFYYCGTGEHGRWRHGGYADTLTEALQKMIDLAQ